MALHSAVTGGIAIQIAAGMHDASSGAHQTLRYTVSGTPITRNV